MYWEEDDSSRTENEIETMIEEDRNNRNRHQIFWQLRVLFLSMVSILEKPKFHGKL